MNDRGNTMRHKDPPHTCLQLFSPLMPEIPYLCVSEVCLTDTAGACYPRVQQ